MYVIVVGGGRVGATLARSLTQGGHEALVIERQEALCAILRDRLGSMVMHGDGCETQVLAEAGAERADLLIAVTESDEDNMVACQVAHHRFHVRRVLARVNSPRNEKLFRLLGITTIGAVEAIVSSVLAKIPDLPLMRLAALRQGALNLFSIRIPEEAASAGRPVTQIALPRGAVIALVLPREGPPVAPSKSVTLAAGDEVLALAAPGDEQALLEALAR